MSTIEKALDKIGDRQQQSAPTHSSTRMHSASKQGSQSAKVTIDLERLSRQGMLSAENGRSQIAEEYRNIKRPVLRNVLSEDENVPLNINLIMVTSAVPGEGKTFNSVNLAMSIAMELDHTCLLVDADVARPSVMKTLGLSRSKKGLVDYLLSHERDLSEYLLSTNIPKLTILPSGKAYTHATELLASEDMRDLMRELSERYHDRIVIFDTPPLLATTESRVLSTLMGQVIMVVEAEKTQKATVKQALSLLDERQNISLILNKNRKEGGHDYYYYGYAAKDQND